MNRTPARPNRAQAHRLSLGETTSEGPFYARVDGQNIGEDGRCFWPSFGEAQAAAGRFLAKMKEFGHDDRA